MEVEKVSAENAAPIVWAMRPGQPDPDYGKVVDGLNCCIISDREVFCPDDCPYQDDKDGRRCETIMKQEALLLIQQQAQELHDLKIRFTITRQEGSYERHGARDRQAQENVG